MINAGIKRCAPQRRFFSWLALAVVALIGVATVPGLLPHDSALQIRASRQGASLPDGFYVYQTLQAQGIHIMSITPDQDALVIRFDSNEQRHAAEIVLRELFPDDVDISHQQNQGAANWVSHISQRPRSVS